MDQGEPVRRPAVAFGARRQHRRVLRRGALADDVADQRDLAAVREVDFVARLPARTIDDNVVAQVAAPGAALDQVPPVAAVEAAAANRQRGHRAGVEQVRKRRGLVRGEPADAVLDRQHGLRVVGGEDAVLVVEERAVEEVEPPALEADAGAVAVGHARTAELDVADAEIAVAERGDLAHLGAVDEV